MRRAGEVNASRFVDDMLRVIPREAVPPLSSPVTKFFRDLLSWDQKMWSSSTEGLNLVAQAIETGHLDDSRYQEVSGRLERLGQEGPWTSQSGWDYVKKTAEELPVVGKLFKAIWG